MSAKPFTVSAMPREEPPVWMSIRVPGCSISNRLPISDTSGAMVLDPVITSFPWDAIARVWLNTMTMKKKAPNQATSFNLVIIEGINCSTMGVFKFFKNCRLIKGNFATSEVDGFPSRGV